MNGGEPVLGGIKIPHGDTTAPDPGSQPALSDTNPVSDPPQAPSAAPVSTVSQSPPPSTLASQPPLPPTPSPQPTQHPTTPQPQANFSSFQANSQSTIPTNSPVGSATISQPIPRLTNRFSDHPIAEQPFPSPIPNSPTQGTVFNNSSNNIMLSPTPQPKKTKKWLIVTIIILLLATVGLGVMVLASNLLAGPVQQVTDEQYYELNISYSNLSATREMLEDGINNNLSMYDLLLAEYLLENIPQLYDAIYNRTLWEPKPYSISGALKNASEYAENFGNIIESMYGINFPSEIKKKVQELHDFSPRYISAVDSITDKLSHLATAFIENNSEAIEEIIPNNATLFDISLNTTDYLDVMYAWDACMTNIGSNLCTDPIAQNKIENIINDNSTVNSIFTTLLNEDEISLIQTFHSNSDQLINLIMEQQNAE